MTNNTFYDILKIILLFLGLTLIFSYHWKHRDGISFLISFFILIKLTIEIIIFLDNGNPHVYVWATTRQLDD